MTNPLRFKGEYFLTKAELTKKLKKDLEDNGGENLPEVDNVELYELYCQNLFERFGLPNDENKDRNEALADISVLFEIGKVLRLNISEYISIESIEIPLLNGEIKRTSVGSFSILSPIIKLDSVDTCDAESQECIFSFKYKTLKTANQIVTPTLSVSDHKRIISEYNIEEGINLADTDKGYLRFSVPLTNLLENNAGIYSLYVNSDVLCSITIPKVKLPLSRDGVASLKQMKEFLSALNSKPTTDLFFLYFFLRYHFLEYWINDSGIKEKIHKLSDGWEKIGHIVAVNDINSLFPLFGVKNKLCFHIMDYIRIDKVDIEMNDPNCIICSTVSNAIYQNHFIKWKSESKGKICISIQPKENVANWNIEFKIGFRVGSKSLNGEPIVLNLIEQKKQYLFHFNCDDFSEQHMGTYALSLISGQDNIKSNCSFSIIGEVIEFKLSNNIPLKMVGIMAEDGDFYISQTPITQKQLQAIVCGDEEPVYGNIKNALAESIHAHNGENYPATHLAFYDCFEITNYLSDLFNCSFYVPGCKQLFLALSNGFSNDKIKLDAYRQLENVSEVGNNHVTDLNIFDLLNNIYLHTCDSVSHLFSEDERIMFGASCYEQIRDRKKLVHLYREGDPSFPKYKSILGLSPIAFIERPKVDDHYTGTINDNNDDNNDDENGNNSSYSSSESSPWTGDIVKPIDFATFL